MFGHYSLFMGGVLWLVCATVGVSLFILTWNLLRKKK
jgi:hypothetical protein